MRQYAGVAQVICSLPRSSGPRLAPDQLRAVGRSGGLSRADWMLSRLADAGLRMTGQREVVVRAIAERLSPFAPEELVDELRQRGVGRATVYRALDRLEHLGLLGRIHVGGSQGYTVCEEGHHHHLVCASCKTVIPIDAGAVEREIQKLATRLHFRVEAHMLEFAGECAACVARSSEEVGRSETSLRHASTD